MPAETHESQQSEIRDINETTSSHATSIMMGSNDAKCEDQDSITVMCEAPVVLQPAQGPAEPSKGLDQRKLKCATVEDTDKVTNVGNVVHAHGSNGLSAGPSAVTSSTDNMAIPTSMSKPTLWVDVVSGYKAQTQQRTIQDEVTNSDDEEQWEIDACAQLDDIVLQGWIGKVRDQSRHGWISRIQRPNHLSMGGSGSCDTI